MQSLRDREVLHKILERKAESVQGENEAQKNFLKLRPMWRIGNGSKEVSEVDLYETHRELESKTTAASASESMG